VRYACPGDGGDAAHGSGEPAVVELQGAGQVGPLAAAGVVLCGGQGGQFPDGVDVMSTGADCGAFSPLTVTGAAVFFSCVGRWAVFLGGCLGSEGSAPGGGNSDAICCEAASDL